jgi:hypothetical protein
VLAKHAIFCSGTKRSRRLRTGDRELALWGPNSNMELDSQSLARALAQPVPPRLQDLLEIAAYVYVADQAFDRGEETGADLGARWRRDLRFVMGVRDPEFWSGASVRGLLSEAIEFLSDDKVSFEFEAVSGAPDPEPHLALTTGPADWFRDATVLAFSGGLDSLAGAVEEVFGANRHVALVTHRAATKLDPIQRGLADALRAEVVRRGNHEAVHHFPVWVQKKGTLDREFTQRTRSFLFAALGAVVARMIGRDELRFFENGVVSLNLPVCAQVLDARATRTTHPKTLVLFERLLSAVFEAPFRVVNPFLWKTKAEVVQVIQRHRCHELIATSVSCSHTIDMTDAAPHCGACSQCIDRRFGVLAAGAAANDPEAGYRADLFTTARARTDEQTMLETYVLRAREVRNLDERSFVSRYGELNRVLRDLGGSTETNAQQIFALYKRHAEEVARVLGDELARHKDDVVKGTLAPTSLLSMVLPQRAEAVAKPVSGTKGRRTAARNGGRIVRLLHVSDTHFSTTAWDQDHVLSALADDVRSQREARGAPDLVVFTGDIAYSGRAAEYDSAETWLRERLLPAAATTPSNLILVPGNHDVDRSKVKRRGKALHESLLRDKQQNPVAEVLRDPVSRSPLLASHAAWVAFAQRLDASAPDVPWSARVVDVRGVRVHVAVLCSSWCAYTNADQGRLLVGHYQVIKVLDSQSADLKIAALHHPWGMFAEFDEKIVRETLTRKYDFILRGHLHAASAALIVRPDTETLEVAAGASYAGSAYPNAYHWLEIDLDLRRVRVHMRTWDGVDWIADRNAYAGKAKEGYVDFKLGPGPKKTAGKAIRAKRTKNARGRSR